MKKRICATFLALCLIMPLLPASALAAEPGEEESQAAVCTCETLCTEGTVNEQCPVCMADIAACTGEAPQPEAPACTCETLCAEGAVNEQCPVCMTDITACTGEAPQPEVPVCTCETLCAEGAVNELCPVCMADIAACTGEVSQPEVPVCTCETLCAEGAVNELCPVCAGDLSACTGIAEVPETPETPETPEVPETPENTETPETPVEPVPLADNVIYVSSSGDDAFDGSKDKPYATLATAVANAKDGDTIELLSDLISTKYAIISAKDITINGNGFSITRGKGFTPQNDGRGGYNPAMIEVANGTKLTLVNITLDDGLKTEGEIFLEQPTEGDNKQNENKVQDAIIAAYRGGGTIILGNNTVLKNFGGMSAVRIGGPGQGGEGTSTLIMQDGSKIVDDMNTPRSGGVAAIWSQGGKIEMQYGSEISNIDGRAIFLEDGGLATVCGSIENITANSVMTYDPAKGTGLGGGSMGGFGGIAVAAKGNSTFTLGEKGKISSIISDESKSGDVAVMLENSTFATENNSTVSNIDIIGLVDSNGGKIILGGNLTACQSKNVLFRLRGGGEVTFKLLGSGSIVKCTAETAMLYLNGGKPNIEVAGTIDDINVPALWISNNGSRQGGTVTLTETGVITNIKGAGIRAQDPSTVTIAGTITNCSSYAVIYEPKATQSLLKIEGTATIQDNNRGKAQIQVTEKLTATNAQEHVEIAPGGLDGNKTIDLKAFDVTLDDGYASIQLGNANSSAVDAIKASVEKQYPGWKVLGSSALWFQPSEESVHFAATKPYGIKKTSLFAAYIPLNEDGTPVAGFEAELKEVTYAESIDVALDGLSAGQSYALMFVNNLEYTLSPDDITVYTGGGQNDEIYDNGGLPKLTLSNCIDKISNNTEVLIDGTAVPGDAAAKMKAITDLFTVTYTDQDGKKITNDETPGEYTATLSWADGTPKTLKIGGNDVKKDFETGTLIVRHTEDKEEAEKGTNTYLLEKNEPTEQVTNAVAIAKEGFLGSDPNFYINGDSNREITKTDGISILDDSLLLEHENDNRQQLMEQKAADFLGDAGDKKAYAFDFHYLDLVDAYNGNAWVSASYGTIVYLPYPAGTDSTTKFTLVHYKDLHREYGISGQENVEQAILACDLEKIPVTNTEYGIKFEVDSSGFSPFALVWTVDAHTITATAGPGGSITPSGAVTVADGMGEYFTITANPGYYISDVKVDNTSVGAVSSYSFTNVTKDHTITAIFAEDSSGGSVDPSPDDYTLHYVTNGGKHLSAETKSHSWTKAYEDLPTPVRDGYTFAGWYWDLRLTDPVRGDVKVDQTTVDLYAKWEADGTVSGSGDVSHWLDTVNHKAFLSGYPDGTFGTDQNMTRAEVAQMFYALLLDKDVAITKTFTDVPADAWYAKAVNTLASLGMLGGYPDGTFQPERTITRAEFAVVALAFTDGGSGASCSFTDVNRSDWFYQYAAQASEYGWIGGYPDGSFRPNNPITRAEVSVIVNNMLERSADARFIDRNQDKLVSFTDLASRHWAYHAIMEATNTHTYTKEGSSEVWNTIK